MDNRIIKYFLIGLIAFIAIRYIPYIYMKNISMTNIEILNAATTISIGYAVIEKFLPSYV